MSPTATVAEERGFTLWFRGRDGRWFPAAMTRTHSAAVAFLSEATGDWRVLPAGEIPNEGGDSDAS